MDNYNEKLNISLIPKIKDIKNLNILEFGVQNGTSTLKFLEICENNNGYLYSVDIEDCKKVSQNKRWKFIKSRDDNFDFIKSQIPDRVDVIFIDTTHEADHVEKIIYGYYDLLNVNGYLFIDDISHLPYLFGSIRDNFYCEINNKETFNRILQIYYSNYNNLSLDFSFDSSGLTIIKKKNEEKLKKKITFNSRENSVKNLIRRLWIYMKRKL
tara:strand:+ start:4789 stop:5424 length:636 start_codon:yes stop_codon:yes gene_type:complete